MAPEYTATVTHSDLFASPDEFYADLKQQLTSGALSKLQHAEVERQLFRGAQELMRRLLESHYTLRAQGEPIVPVVGSDGEMRTHLRSAKHRRVETIFGAVRLSRTGFGGRGLPDLHPVDADLNLPSHKYSHELERWAVLNAVEMSYDSAIQALRRTTSSSVGKRTIELLMGRAAIDFEEFYQSREWTLSDLDGTGPLLILTVDQKGIVMLPGDLTPETRRVAEAQRARLKAIDNRDGKAHWPGQKKMATVAAVYTIQRDHRSASDVARGLRRVQDSTLHTRRTVQPELKRLWASIVQEPQLTVCAAVEEALKRDPKREKTWIVLVDGDPDLEKWIRRAFKTHGIKADFALDLIHALQYLWNAGKEICTADELRLEDWVLERVERLLKGKVSDVVAGMRRSATKLGLTPNRRKAIEKCANYFLKRKHMMRYDKLLAWGAPIATGVIEGGCKHLIQNRLERTRAKWSLQGAEAVLKMRAIAISADFEKYWTYHEDREFSRNHVARYANGTPPELVPIGTRRGHLTLLRPN